MCRELTVPFGSHALIKPFIKSCPPSVLAIWQKKPFSCQENFQTIDINDARYYGSSIDPDKPILQIQKASYEDSLCYRLQVSNGIGTTSEMVSIYLKGEVTEIIWTKDNKQINISDSGGKYTASGSNNDPSLVIHRVNSNDAGKYQCRVSNAVGDMYSSLIQLGLPNIEEHISWSEKTLQLTCSVTVTSIPEVHKAEWRVQQAPGDGFKAINIHDSLFRGSTVSLPHPILNIHGFNPELHHLIQFRATNFIGEMTKTIQTTIGKTNQNVDVFEREVGNNIIKYQNGSAAVLFANLRYDLAVLFPQSEIENIKCLLCGLSILNQNTVREMFSMSDILNVLEKEGYFSPEDVIWVQYCLRKIGCRDLYEKCYQYAKQNEALCFYENQPERNGYRHVEFHVAGNVKNYSVTEIYYIQKTVATMIGCTTEELIVDGLKPDKSFLVVLSIKDEYIDALLTHAEQILENMSDLNVDYLVFEKKIIRRKILDKGATGSELRTWTPAPAMLKQTIPVSPVASYARDTTSLSSVNKTGHFPAKRLIKTSEEQKEKELEVTETIPTQICLNPMTTKQNIITCGICKRGPPQHFCNVCKIPFCPKCVVSHLESESLDGHVIVHFKERDARNIQPKGCLKHPSKVKTLYCRECFAEICVSCIAEHRKHMHEVTDWKQFVNLQFSEIAKSSEHLCNKLPKCRQNYENLKLLLEETDRKYDQEHQKILDTGEDLHRKINEKVEGLLDEIKNQKKESLKMLQDMIKNVKSKLEEMEQAINMCEATKSSLDEVLKFTFDESSFDIEHTIEVTFPQFKTPRTFTVDVGLLKSIREEKRLIDKPLEEDTPEKEIKKEGHCLDNVLFIENANLQPIANFLENCQSYKEDFQFGGELDEAATEYNRLLKKAKETGCPVQKNAPPIQLNAVTPNKKCQAPCLYELISDVAKRCPNAKWMDALTEFMTLTTYSQAEPRHAKRQRPRSTSGYQKKKEKEYRNSIEKLLDQEWDPEFIPKSAVEYDYRHFYTSESVLRSSFPDAYIFNMASSTLSKPDDVPLEFRERNLFHFLLSIDMKKYGVKPEDAWRDFGRCILAEKQLDLARRAVGPVLDKNVIVSKHNFYKLQNEVKEKTEEIEELSTRLSKFASQQLTEGNPNIADLSDTHRPTRLGEMYSQLFDDEWSEAFEAFKPKKDEDEEEEDDDIFPDTLFILQNMLKEIFEFCKTQSQKQLVKLEDSFATVIGLKEPKVTKQKNGERADENQTNGEGDSSEQPKVSDESVQEKESAETDETSDNKQLKDIQTPPADDGGEDELFQQTKLSTDKTEKENIAGEANDNQTDEDKPGNTGTDNKDSEKDLTKDEAGDQPKPSEGDNDNNNQDTTVTDPEKGEDATNNFNNASELDKNINVDDKAKDTSDKKQEGEQTSEEKAADPNVDRNEEPNEKMKSEDPTSSPEDQNKELLESGEQPNIQQPAGKETSEDGEKKEEDKPEQREGEEVPDKASEEEDGGNEPDGEEEKGPEEEEEEERMYRTDPAFPMIERHAREFRKASAATSAKTKSTLFIKVELPNLVADEGVREDLRTLTYVRKCVELCWYMCMQDPPMVIISPERGQEIDKGLFSLHGRRGKTVEVCVWPALLLHDGGPLVCKGYVLPEERKRKK